MSTSYGEEDLLGAADINLEFERQTLQQTWNDSGGGNITITEGGDQGKEPHSKYNLFYLHIFTRGRTGNIAFATSS
jgi:hypothetical protein